jgi:hypothetical protein
LSLIAREYPVWRNALGCVGLILFVPLLLILALIALILSPFQRPRALSAEEVAQYLRDFIDGTFDALDIDDFIPVPLADPRLESIRAKALRWLEGKEEVDLGALLAEADAVTADDRAGLTALLRWALDEDDVTTELVDKFLPHPQSLGTNEAKAYQALSRWTDDEDIRSRDVGYARHQRDALAAALSDLSNSPDET